MAVRVEFASYSAVAMLVHSVIAIPAVLAIARFITGITLGYGIFRAVKPKKRVDIC